MSEPAVTPRDFLLRLGERARGEHEGWAWGTNGYSMLALHAESGIEPHQGYLKPETFATICAKLFGWVADAEKQEHSTADLADLRGFVGCLEPCKTCRDTNVVQCRECGGAGTRTVTCDDCDETHECHCRNCEDGQSSCGTCDSGQRPARIGGCLVNLVEVARWLRAFPSSGPVRFVGQSDAKDDKNGRLVLWTDDARLVVMGLRDSQTWRNQDPIPSFEVPA